MTKVKISLSLSLCPYKNSRLPSFHDLTDPFQKAFDNNKTHLSLFLSFLPEPEAATTRKRNSAAANHRVPRLPCVRMNTTG